MTTGTEPQTHDAKAVNAEAERWAKLAGRFLYKPHVAWWGDQRWYAPYRRYDPSPRVLDRRFTVVEFARSVRTLPGSTAECGVYRGVASALIAKTLEDTYGADDRHFGFDSFEGLSEPGPGDARTRPDDATPALLRRVLKGSWRKGDMAVGLEVAGELLAEFSFVELVKGWIPACFGPADGHRFRLVHIDVDIEEPTWDSLEFFYPRTVSRGVFLFDDYGFLSCPGARAAVDRFFADKPEPVVELATGQAFAIKV